MAKDEAARAALDRVAQIYRQRPDTARSTTQGQAVLEQGLAASFTAGDHAVTMDMPPIMGGDGTGPTPGFFARAGIAGCVAIGIKIAALRAGISLDGLTIDVTTDFDDSAMFELGEASAAPLETRLEIAVRTAADPDVVQALIAAALERDPWFLALRDAQRAVPYVCVTAP